MRRRDVLRRIGVASVAATASAGVGTAAQPDATIVTDGPTAYVNWTFDDGRTELIELDAFDQRADTPPVERLSFALSEPTCCAWSDNPGCRDCDYDFEIA